MNMIIKKEAATLERTSANEGVQLQSLTLSEGTIRFEPDVTDYNVTAVSYTHLDVYKRQHLLMVPIIR